MRGRRNPGSRNGKRYSVSLESTEEALDFIALPVEGPVIAPGIHTIGFSTTVVDRLRVEGIRVFGSGIGEHGIGVFCANSTSAGDVQRRASLATVGA